VVELKNQRIGGSAIDTNRASQMLHDQRGIAPVRILRSCGPP
jgi:hypothetical protein